MWDIKIKSHFKTISNNWYYSFYNNWYFKATNFVVKLKALRRLIMAKDYLNQAKTLFLRKLKSK